MGLMKFFGLDKVVALGRTFKQHGGIGASFKQMFITDDLKEGKLVGIDKFGNRYWENNKYAYPRNRWVDFSRSKWFDYDASQIPPEWHRWLVQSTDIPPNADESLVFSINKVTHEGKIHGHELHEQHRWLMEHKENLSGQTLNRENELYMPYSTTRPKVTGWVPQQRKSSSS